MANVRVTASAEEGFAGAFDMLDAPVLALLCETGEPDPVPVRVMVRSHRYEPDGETIIPVVGIAAGVEHVDHPEPYSIDPNDWAYIVPLATPIRTMPDVIVTWADGYEERP